MVLARFGRSADLEWTFPIEGFAMPGPQAMRTDAKGAGYLVGESERGDVRVVRFDPHRSELVAKCSVELQIQPD